MILRRDIPIYEEEDREISYLESCPESTEIVKVNITTNPIFFVKEKNIYLFERFAVTTNRDQSLCNIYNGFDSRYFKSKLFSVALSKKMDRKVNYVLVERVYSAGYYRFLCHTIPAIHLGLASINNPVFVLYKMNEWQRKVFEKLAPKNINYIEIDQNKEHYFPQLYICSLNFRHASEHTEESWFKVKKDIFDYLTKHTEYNPDSPKKIYISRRNVPSGRRPITNEKNIELIFEKKGFEIIEPQKLTMDEQVCIFHSADVIAGSTGAAFSNIIFCRPKTKLIVLQHNTLKKRCGGFATMGCMLDMIPFVYNEFDLNESNELKFNDTRGWTVNENRLNKFIKDINV